MDSQIVASSVSSDGISRKRTLEKSQIPNELPTKKCTQGSSSSHQKIVLASSATCKSSSVLRQPLSDDLFDYCFGIIWKETPEVRRNQFTYLNSYFFRLYTMKHTRESALTWIKKNIFSKCYVFVPIVYESHWSLLILCHFGESLESKTTTPCMLFLDSLHAYGARTNLEPLIRSLVLDIFRTEGRSESKDLVERIPLLIPKVPQQRDDKECGIYVLYYVNLFLEGAPLSFSISSGYPHFLKEDWFTEEDVEQFYEKLESLGLESSCFEDDLVSPNFEAIQYLDGDTCVLPESDDIQYLDNDTWVSPEPEDIQYLDASHAFEDVQYLDGDTCASPESEDIQYLDGYICVSPPNFEGI
ncbi:hypothetical protein ACS0TY_005273 [Phlomoides rotata]